MKLKKEDLIEFVNNHRSMEIKFNYYKMQDEIDFHLCSFKLNVVVGIFDSNDNLAIDKSLYIDYVYLDDGMKAWQIQVNSKFLEKDGIEKIKELLPKFFNGEKISTDNDLIKPLYKNCNFDKDNIQGNN